MNDFGDKLFTIYFLFFYLHTFFNSSFDSVSRRRNKERSKRSPRKSPQSARRCHKFRFGEESSRKRHRERVKDERDNNGRTVRRSHSKVMFNFFKKFLFILKMYNKTIKTIFSTLLYIYVDINKYSNSFNYIDRRNFKLKLFEN